jgi:hypothetical protein
MSEFRPVQIPDNLTPAQMRMFLIDAANRDSISEAEQFLARVLDTIAGAITDPVALCSRFEGEGLEHWSARAAALALKRQQVTLMPADMFTGVAHALNEMVQALLASDDAEVREVGNVIAPCFEVMTRKLADFT